MSEVKFNATIHEPDGTFYTTQIDFVPRVGEFIDFHSFVDQIENRLAKKYYEVVRIVHKIDEVTDRASVAKGSHFVQIFVETIKRPTEEFPSTIYES